MNHSLVCLTIYQSMYSLRRMGPFVLSMVFICLIPTGQCSPSVRNIGDQRLERWEQPSGERRTGGMEHSSVLTNEHPTQVEGDVDRQLMGGGLLMGSIPSPGEAGLLSSTMIKITGDRTHEEGYDVRLQRRPVADVIQGSRRAFSITKLEYLKKEWCKTERFKQVIRDEGCLKRVIINRFCYGQCNSFFIPKSNRNDPDSAAFKSCAFCRPRKSSNITVTLVCPNRRPRLKRRKILVVKQCRCMAQALD